LRDKDGHELFDAPFSLRQAREKKDSIKTTSDSADVFPKDEKEYGA
jgi:hypothetical protein